MSPSNERSKSKFLTRENFPNQEFIQQALDALFHALYFKIWVNSSNYV